MKFIDTFAACLTAIACYALIGFVGQLVYNAARQPKPAIQGTVLPKPIEWWDIEQAVNRMILVCDNTNGRVIALQDRPDNIDTMQLICERKQ